MSPTTDMPDDRADAPACSSLLMRQMARHLLGQMRFHLDAIEEVMGEYAILFGNPIVPGPADAIEADDDSPGIRGDE